MMRAILPLLLLGIVRTAAGAPCPGGSATAAFVAPGPYGVGVRTLALVDGSRPTPAHGTVASLPSRTLTTEVWYPTAPHAGDPVRDAEAAHGRFPVILNSHGYADNRTGEAYLAMALASRGYVVAAPDFPLTNLTTQGRDPIDVENQPDDVRFVLDSVLDLSKAKDSWLAGRVDRHRIGASGLSYGGLTTLLVTFHPARRDRRIRAAAALAPVSCSFEKSFFRAARPPLLLVQGTQDLLLPIAINSARVYAEARSPRTFVQLRDASHSAFSGLLSFPSAVNYDVALGCPLVVNEFGGPNWTRLQLLDDPANGIDVAGCSMPCLGPAPSNPPMQAARQHDLTQAMVVAFFESTFRKSRPARCFVKQGFAAENADVVVEHHRAGR